MSYGMQMHSCTFQHHHPFLVLQFPFRHTPNRKCGFNHNFTDPAVYFRAFSADPFRRISANYLLHPFVGFVADLLHATGRAAHPRRDEQVVGRSVDVL